MYGIPKKLAEINDCPSRLYSLGNPDPKIFDKTIGVVGSRRMTSYGKRAVELLVAPLAARGVTIVSGFMYGVDSYAHEVCVEAGGRTIAVLPYGISYRPPNYQAILHENILKSGGLFVSEFAGDFPPAVWTFPKRNRIVAGLSDAVLIVEAGVKSGSLITANFAMDFDRKLFAVPGPIDSAVSEGTNNLIKSHFAEAVTSHRDVLEFFGMKEPVNMSPPTGLKDQDEEIIYSCARLEGLTLDEISEKSGLDISIVGHKTMMMCLAGVLVEKEGKFYVG